MLARFADRYYCSSHRRFACQCGAGASGRFDPQATLLCRISIIPSGEYGDALQEFRSAARQGVFSAQGRWVDAICYHAMIGDCYYHLGEFDQALDQHDAAIRVFLDQKNWLNRVQFPPRISPSANRRSSITWGATSRVAVLGKIPSSMLCLQGRLDNDVAIKKGGVVAAPEFVSLRVPEVIRCLALAIRRRAELMGPSARIHPLTGQLLSALATRPAPANHWSQGWIDVLLGLANLGAGKNDQATEQLQRSIVLDGRYDHLLTSTVLLELGKLAAAQNQWDAARGYLLEATYAAETFDQADVMEEAFRYAAMAHLVTNQEGVFTPLLPAAAWARRQSFHALSASLLILASEGLVYRDQARQASSVLGDASRQMARRQMHDGRIGARYQYQLALVNFEQGKTKQGEAALNAAMLHQQKSSLRLFQIALVDRLFMNDRIMTPRNAANLFAEVLREPTNADWTTNPMETMSTVVTYNLRPWVHWFYVTLDNKQYEEAIAISDRIRRRRFFASLPHGGRLLSLRWILEAPDDVLSETANRQRQDMLVKYPQYHELSKRAAASRESILAFSPSPADAAAARELTTAFKQLAKTSADQETTLRRLSVRRDGSEFVFPPFSTTADVRSRLGPGQIVLAFFATDRQLHAFSLTQTKYNHRAIQSVDEVEKLTATLLRNIGNFKKNSQLPADQLQDETWKQTAAKLYDLLFRELIPLDWKEYQELIIVPDGMLWYLPFEALLVEENEARQPLISKVRVRYAPTISLANPLPGGLNRTERLAIVGEKIYVNDPEELTEDATNDLLAAHRGAFRLAAPQLAPTQFRAPFWDQLVVFQDVQDARNARYDWAPVQLGRARSGNTLADWIHLPWGAPARVILPGYHTAAEESAKRGQEQDGSEIFYSACGMMASGSRTILLSRWRTGGQVAYDLVREFSRELPFANASSAWQRSVQLATQTELDPTLEPRVRWPNKPISLRAEHPFFWAGPMLIDTGRQPRGDERKPANGIQPVNHVKAN